MNKKAKPMCLAFFIPIWKHYTAVLKRKRIPFEASLLILLSSLNFYYIIRSKPLFYFLLHALTLKKVNPIIKLLFSISIYFSITNENKNPDL